MARRRRVRKPLMYEFYPWEKYVHETMKPASACERGQYRSRMVDGTQVVICCPRGTKMDFKKRCCVPKRGAKACVTKPMTQSFRHKVEKFKTRHPDIWEKLISTKPDPDGAHRLYRR